MKTDTLVRLYTEDDINQHVFNMWKTDIFRDSHASGGFVAQVVRPFTSMPCFFYDPSDEKLEKAHFSTWWRGMQNREYDNDYIHDLYALHEMHHAGHMIFARGLSHDAFKRKMMDNELDASVCSEIEVYFRIPGLREKSFKQDIYADRFLNDPEMQKRWALDPDRVVRELRMYRQNIMMTELPRNHPDRSEFWIKQFVHQNESWAATWVHRYEAVEDAMVRMRKTVMAGSKVQALDDHLDFLLSDKIAYGGTVPFPHEANAFCGIYWLNKQAYEVDNAEQLQRKAVAVATPSANIPAAPLPSPGTP